MAIVTRHVGTCPICLHQQKVMGKVLAHHGYQRPGWGYIVGPCFGSRRSPYELSSSTCTAFKERLLKFIIPQLKEKIADLEARPESMDEYSKFRRETKTYRRDAEDRIERDNYERILKSQLGQNRSYLKMAEGDVARMDRMIQDWKLAPLIEIDEMGRTAESRAAVEARRGERVAARAAKDAKRAELDRKRLERESAQTAVFDSFVRKFHALAQMPESADRNLQARRLNAEIQKKKYKLPGGLAWEIAWNDPRRRGIEDDLIKLGLGERTYRGDHSFFDWHKHKTAAGAPAVPESPSDEGASAEKHERGENPRTARSAKDVKLKDRMMALVGRGRRRF